MIFSVDLAFRHTPRTPGSLIYFYCPGKRSDSTENNDPCP